MNVNMHDRITSYSLNYVKAIRLRFQQWQKEGVIHIITYNSPSHLIALQNFWIFLHTLI